jgi:hypothetical protein
MYSAFGSDTGGTISDLLVIPVGKRMSLEMMFVQISTHSLQI